MELTITGKHIAMVVRSFSVEGGLELYTHKLVEGLLKEGLKVTVICAESSTALTHNNLHIVQFAAAPPHLNKWQRLRHYFQASTQALRQSGPFDLVHSQHLPAEGTTVVTFHNHTIQRLSKVGTQGERLINEFKTKVVPAYRLRNQYDELLVRNAHCLVFSSQTCRDDFYETYRLPNEKPWVVAYPGAALGTSTLVNPPGQTLALMPGSKGEVSLEQDETASDLPVLSFLFVGKGYRKKGLDVLLKACQQLLSQKFCFRLQIAGLRERPLDTVRLAVMGLTKTVAYLGYQKSMDQVYAHSSVLVMPSRIEPFGMAALQAMQHGLVPIISRVAGVSEIIKHGTNGLVLEDHLNSQELAQHMAVLMKDPNLLAEMSRRSRDTSCLFTWDKTVESTLQAYRLALGC